jgi:endonuclease/exonuclease/phosphatase family metal-dependent hydrolase
MKTPSYAQAINRGLDAFAAFIKSAPTVVAGDFNTHPAWDHENRRYNHSTLVERLESEFGLMSAYHAHKVR